MRRIDKNELKNLFLSSLKDFKTIDGEKNPFQLTIFSKTYYIFLKNLSPAYFKNSPDVTRIQIPTSDHFKRILKSDIQFLAFGYDSDNDTFTVWNPAIVKKRLNAKDNVSIYSRSSVQQEGKNAKGVVKGYLSTGEEFLVFNRNYTGEYLRNLESLFPENSSSKPDENKSNNGEKNATPKSPTIVLPQELIDLFIPDFKDNLVLKSVGVCMKYFTNKGENISFKQAFELVTAEYEKFCHE